MIIGVDYIGVGCGALIVNDQNQVLLLKRTNKTKANAGQWSQPGGTVEFGDTVEDTVIREVKEELNIDVELVRPLGFTKHIIPEENKHWVSLEYLVKIVGGELINMEPEKHSEMRWFGLEELPENLTDPTKDSISRYQDA